MKTTTLLLTIALLFTLARPPEAAQPKMAVECVVAITVLVVGVVVIVQLKKLCSKIPPSTTPPPAPPAPPKKAVASKAEISGPTLTLADDAVAYSDISAMGYQDGSGFTYQAMFSATVQSSTNLITWQNEFTMIGWSSGASCVAVFSKDGLPISTNWCDSNRTITASIGGTAADKKFFRLASHE